MISCTVVDTMCDQCNSSHIVETDTGFVCSNCGIELEDQRFSHHIDYFDNRNLTWYGRHLTNPDLQRQQKQDLQYSQNYNKYKKKIIRKEIERILSSLDLDLKFTKHVLKRVLTFRNLLEKGTKLRNHEKLIPPVIYYFFKIQGVPIAKHKLI
ncbi:MAG: hypothetical protein GF317_20175 [Candidatus Lokiarchaeota archaeon]|nr:hypothetical protein [Candidatus Lokiarchaeota archaeon]MBD3201800.1 hypothetical protein [Candidatus Lokiarchaeota archaeon]